MNGLLTALSLLALTSPAFAQDLLLPSVTADPDVAFDCLASGKSAETCTGAMTVDCQAENPLENQNLEERLCVIEEANLWRDLVRSTARDLSSRLENRPADLVIGLPRPAFDAAQAAWEGFVEAECRFVRARDAGEDRRAIAENTCQRDLTAARYDRLRELREGIPE